MSVLLFLLFYLLLFSGGKLSLDFHDLFYNLNFEKEKLLLKDLFEGCLILNYYCYELVFTFFVHGSGLPASFGRL